MAAKASRGGAARPQRGTAPIHGRRPLPTAQRRSLLTGLVAIALASAVIAIPGTPAGATAHASPSAAVGTQGDGSSVTLAGVTGSRLLVRLPQALPVRSAIPLVRAHVGADVVVLGVGQPVAGDLTLLTVLPSGSAATAAAQRVLAGTASLDLAWSGGSASGVVQADLGLSSGPTSSAAALAETLLTRPRAAATPTTGVPGAGVGDPGTPGSHATVMRDYSLGNTAVTLPSGYPSELTAEITVPVSSGGARWPVVVVLHGRHTTCGTPQGAATLQWPCPAGYSRIPSEQGYRELATLLASRGMAVVSIAANGINATDSSTADLGARDRAWLILKHLDLLRSWDSGVAGPITDLVQGRLDFSKVGLLGHSRGGEGVVRALALNAIRLPAKRFGIIAVMPLAPVDFSRFSVKGTASFTMIGNCDGDVSDLQGVHYLDDVQVATRTGDTVPHALMLLYGANHNFFNTVWTPGGWPAGTMDDWNYVIPGDPASVPSCDPNGTQRLSSDEQVQALDTYASAFFGAQLMGQTANAAWLSPAAAVPASASFSKSARVLLRRSADRLTLDPLTTANDLINTSNGGKLLIRGASLSSGCGGTFTDASACLARPSGVWGGDEPHLSSSFNAPNIPGLPQLRLRWTTSGAYVRVKFAVPIDVRSWTALSWRIARNALDAEQAAGARSVMVSIADITGKTSTRTLLPLALGGPVVTVDNVFNPVPHAVLGGIETSLTGFGTVDMSRVARIDITTVGTTGEWLLSDISLVR